MIGKIISHYKILEKLGEGGMGVVYKAKDTRLDRFVALKFLPAHLSQAEEEKKRFIQEAKAASALDHPNICTIHEVDETKDGQLFIAMAFYKGKTLKQKIACGPLQLAEATNIATLAADALTRAHEARIIHRDIKPANIMITERGEVKILDFGLAKLSGQTKLTKSGMTVGTAAYMSPEQARGENVDHRSDIWSLGVVLYEMLTGEPPFKGDYEQALVYSIMNEDPEPITALRSGLPMELERIVNKALAKQPEERYQHSEEIVVDLKAVSKGQQITDKARLPTTAASMRPKRNAVYTGLIALIIFVILGGVYIFTDRNGAIDSLAVMPFENVDKSPQLDYLCGGISETITNSLSRLSNLKVISSSAVRRYAGRQVDPQTVANELNVRAVLVGKLFKLGNRLAIRVELVDTHDKRQLWGEQYDRHVKDLLNTQRDIAQEISQKLRLKLSSGDKRGLEKTYTQNIEAYQAYLKGLHHWNRFTVKGFLQSIDYYQQALQIDRNYALAYAGLALSYTMLGSHHGGQSPYKAIAKAREAALKALELDDTLSEAFISLGIIKFFFDWDWSSAGSALIRAIELSPNSAMAHQHYALYLSAMGRTQEAIEEGKRALALDPLSPKIKDDLALYYVDLSQYNEAIKQWQTLLEIDPTFVPARRGLGLVYIQMGLHKQAIEKFREAAELSGKQPQYMGYLGWALAQVGNKREALKILQQLKQQGSETSAMAIVMIYGGLGEKDQAFAWLEKAYLARSNYLAFIKVEPYFDSLRSDPRFTALLEKMRL